MGDESACRASKLDCVTGDGRVGIWRGARLNDIRANLNWSARMMLRCRSGGSAFVAMMEAAHHRN